MEIQKIKSIIEAILFAAGREVNIKEFIMALEMNKEEIANFIGIPRPSLSRELIKLRKEKIIDFDRNNITILDIDKLEEILFH